MNISFVNENQTVQIHVRIPFITAGDIQITEDMTSYFTVGYDLDITVSDGRNTVGPKTLTIIMTGTVSEIKELLGW
jgi:hypothetical protein